MVVVDPSSFREAMTSSDVSFCHEAIHDKMNSIMFNHAWESVDLPPGAKTVDCKWVFNKKLRVDGTVEKYKARLVPKGHKWKVCDDLFDTYKLWYKSR